VTITIITTLKCLLLIFLFVIPSPAKPQAGTGMVKGEIRLPNGEPAADVRVSVIRAYDRTPGTEVILEHIVRTNTSGQYSINGISPGRYYVVAGAIQALTYYPGSNSPQAGILTIEAGSALNDVNFVIPAVPALANYSERQRIALAAATATHIKSNQEPSLPLVYGKVVFDGGRAFLPTLYVHLANAPNGTVYGEDGKKLQRSGTGGATPVSKDGTFQLSVPKGEYSLSLITSLGDPLSVADGYYVKSMSFGPADLLKEKLRNPGLTSSMIVITLAPALPTGK
jgi:hypothetical protein